MPLLSLASIARVAFTWNNVLRVVGLAGVAHETLVNNVDRPTLLLLFAAMIGLPAFINQDAKQAVPSPPPAPTPVSAPETSP